MRVLMVVRPAAGGMKEHVLALARGLSARGHAVEIAAPRDLRSSAAAAGADGLTVHPVPIAGPLHPLAGPPGGHRAAAHRASRRVRPGPCARLQGRVRRPAAVPPLGGLDALRRDRAQPRPASRTRRPAAAKWRYRTVERALARYVAHYIAVSDSIRAELVEDYGLRPDRVTTVHNGVEPRPSSPSRTVPRAAQRSGVPAEAPTFGLAARFSTQKGLRDLIAALADLRTAVPGVLLLLGGSGPLESELREQAAALEVGSAIRWLGHVDDMPRVPRDARRLRLAVGHRGARPRAHRGRARRCAHGRHRRRRSAARSCSPSRPGCWCRPPTLTTLARAIVRLLVGPHARPRARRLRRARAASSSSTRTAMVEGTLAVYAAVLGAASASRDRTMTRPLAAVAGPIGTMAGPGDCRTRLQARLAARGLPGRASPRRLLRGLVPQVRRRHPLAGTRRSSPGSATTAPAALRTRSCRWCAPAGHTAYLTYPVDAFTFDRTRFAVTVGPNTFSDSGVSLDLDCDGMRLTGRARRSGHGSRGRSTRRRPGSWARTASSRGWRATTAVCSLDHELTGALELNGELLDFEGGRGYAEKDWGRSFPSSWVWAQSNHFDRPSRQRDRLGRQDPLDGQLVRRVHRRRVDRRARCTASPATPERS